MWPRLETLGLKISKGEEKIDIRYHKKDEQVLIETLASKRSKNDDQTKPWNASRLQKGEGEGFVVAQE